MRAKTLRTRFCFQLVFGVVFFLLFAGAVEQESIPYEYLIRQRPPVDFFRAATLCEGFNATLATPKTLKQNTYLQNLYAILESSWIGLRETNNKLNWIDGTKWQPSQAYFTNGESALNTSSATTCVTAGAGEKWKYASCGLRKGFICQRNRTDVIKGQLLMYSGIPANVSKEIVVPFSVCLPTKALRILPSVDGDANEFRFTLLATSIYTWGFKLEVTRTDSASATKNVVLHWVAEFAFTTTAPPPTTNAMTTAMTTEMATTVVWTTAVEPTTTFEPTTATTTPTAKPTTEVTTTPTTVKSTTAVNPTTTFEPTTTTPTAKPTTEVTTTPTTVKSTTAVIPTTAFEPTTIALTTTTNKMTTARTTDILTTSLHPKIKTDVKTSLTTLTTEKGTIRKTANLTTQPNPKILETTAVIKSKAETTTSNAREFSCTGGKIYDPTTGKTFTFPTTPLYLTTTSLELCPNGRSEASVDCLSGRKNVPFAHFGHLVVITCNLNVAQATENASTANATLAAVRQAVANLKLVTSSASNLSSQVVNNATLAIFHISNVSSKPVAVHTLYDAMVTTDQLTSKLPKNGANNHKGLLRKSLQNFADRVALPKNDRSVTVTSGNLTIQANKAKKTPENTFKPISFPSQTNNQQPVGGQVAVTVPSPLLVEASQQKNKPSVKISFIYFNNSNLFPAQHNPVNVISVSIKGFQPKTATPAVEITFDGVNATQGEVKFTNGTLKSVVTRTQCSVYQSANQRWIPNGCYLVEGSSPPKCSCSTLASFSMIVSSRVLPSNFEMAIVSYIGLSLSILALLLTICIYVNVRELSKRQPTLFLVNIGLNLMIADLVFLLGVSLTQNRDVCYMVTALLQYFLLTSWFWMTANAYNMYKALTKMAYIGGTSATKPMLICYLIPLIITIINCTIAISHDDQLYYPGNNFFDSVYRSRKMCWLHDTSLYFGFLLPVGILALLNVGFFVVVIWKITCRKSSIASTHSRSKKDDLAIAFAVLIMMGLTWVFGYLMLLSDNIAYLSVMAWLFTILNAFQGVLIFALNCLRQEKIRKMWLHPCIDFITCRKKEGNLDTELSQRPTSGTNVTPD